MTPLAFKFALVAVGGAIGAAARYGISLWLVRPDVQGFPWSTFTVNIIGCFAIGVLWAWSARTPLDPRLVAFLFVGVIGSFTTFSTFGLDAVVLVRSGALATAGVYVILSNVVGIGAVIGGIALGRVLTASGG